MYIVYVEAIFRITGPVTATSNIEKTITKNSLVPRASQMLNSVHCLIKYISE
jgi:hypothetical protein